MWFISYKFFPWVGMGKFYTLQLSVSIIKIKSLMLIMTITTLASILYKVYYMLGTRIRGFGMFFLGYEIWWVWIVITDYSILEWR